MRADCLAKHYPHWCNSHMLQDSLTFQGCRQHAPDALHELIPVVVLARWQQIVDCAALEHGAWLEAQEVWVGWMAVHLQSFREHIRKTSLACRAVQSQACRAEVNRVGPLSLLNAGDRSHALFMDKAEMPFRQGDEDVQQVGSASHWSLEPTLNMCCLLMVLW